MSMLTTAAVVLSAMSVLMFVFVKNIKSELE